MSALDRVAAVSSGTDPLLLNGAEGILMDAVAELARRQDFLLHLFQTIGLAQMGWETMEIWENNRK